MVYDIAEIKKRVRPVAQKYRLPAVYLFGSYARGDATEVSDLDFLINKNSSKIKSLFDLGALYEDLDSAFEVSIDIVTTDAIQQEDSRLRSPQFYDTLIRERIPVYEKF